MNEWMLPTPKSVLRKLLDAYANAGSDDDNTDAEKPVVVWDTATAAADLMLDMECGRKRSLRARAARWGWSKNAVSRSLPALEEIVETRLVFYRKDENGKSGTKVGQTGTKVGQNGAKNGVKTQVLGQSGTGVGQAGTSPPYISRASDLDLELKDKLESNDSCQNGHAVSTLTAQQIVDSWNEFASSNGLATVRQLTPKRKEWIRLRRSKIVPVLDEVYASILREPFLMGRVPGKHWRIDFDYVWRNGDNYVKILEGGHWGVYQDEPRQRTKREFRRY